LRTPLSQAESIVTNADISLNTEIETLKNLSYHAKNQNKIHQVIIMVELGDLREEIVPYDLPPFIRETLSLPNLKIIGVGCNFVC
jgi:ornithine racemase